MEVPCHFDSTSLARERAIWLSSALPEPDEAAAAGCASLEVADVERHRALMALEEARRRVAVRMLAIVDGVRWEQQG